MNSNYYSNFDTFVRINKLNSFAHTRSNPNLFFEHFEFEEPQQHHKHFLERAISSKSLPGNLNQANDERLDNGRFTITYDGNVTFKNYQSFTQLNNEANHENNDYAFQYTVLPNGNFKQKQMFQLPLRTALIANEANKTGGETKLVSLRNRPGNSQKLALNSSKRNSRVEGNFKICFQFFCFQNKL